MAGPEVPPARTVNVLTVNNPLGLTFGGADLTVDTTLTCEGAG